MSDGITLYYNRILLIEHCHEQRVRGLYILNLNPISAAGESYDTENLLKLSMPQFYKEYTIIKLTIF